MDKGLKENVTSGETWLQGGYILIFALFYGISKIVVIAIMLFQFIALLITGQSNPRLAIFSQSLATYIYKLLQFMMSNSDEKPFPFSDWPTAEVLVDGVNVATKKTAKKKVVSKKKATKKKGETGSSES